LKSDNERLKAELATLEQAFAKTSKYLKDNTDNVSIEKIIEGVKKDKNLEQIKIEESCKKYNLQPFMRDEFLNVAWACFKKAL
jgi:hypothetical protein